MFPTISLCLGLLAAGSPASEVRAAVADVESLPPEVRPGVRYLTLEAIEPNRRGEALRVVGYTLNALSRTRSISPPVQITPTLLRFNIGQYASQADDFTAWTAAWEKLAETDPYFHLRTQVIAPAEVGSKNNRSATKAEGGIRKAEQSKSAAPAIRVANSVLQTVTTDGGWVDLQLAARLRQATHSAGAILRADYFVAQATATPRYYDFVGVPDTETAFLKSIGVDAEVIDKLRANAGANLIISGVTSKPRRIVWLQGPLGGVYSTLDVERVDAARDPLRRPVDVILPLSRGEGRGEGEERSRKSEFGRRKEEPQTTSPVHPFSPSPVPSQHPHPNPLPQGEGTLKFQFDVSEWFAVSPNGLWRTALFNAAGRRQDTVPDRVAKDTSDPSGDGIVVPLVSCIRCHREAGLRPFADDQTRLLTGTISLYSYDPTIVERAIEFYDQPRLQRQMAFDRQTYTAAVAQTTDGLTPEQLADALAAVVRNFAYLPVSPEQAAREVGLEPAAFRQALHATRDPIVLLLLEGRSVLRGQWDSSFAEAALAAQVIQISQQAK
ncbi:MAG TPA: hypothetical protein VGJ15_12270 [Pirellulales bacterium]|jgi:hypothetical protein